jgi:protein TonB
MVVRPGSPLAGGGATPDAGSASPGPGQPGGSAAYGPYVRRVRASIQESLHYPLPARRRGLAGTVELELLIASDGAIQEVSVARSSSHPILDGAAVDSARALRPLPPPADLAARPLRLRIPIVFELR